MKVHGLIFTREPKIAHGNGGKFVAGSNVVRILLIRHRLRTVTGHIRQMTGAITAHTNLIKNVQRFTEIRGPAENPGHSSPRLSFPLSFIGAPTGRRSQLPYFRQRGRRNSSDTEKQHSSLSLCSVLRRFSAITLREDDYKKRGDQSLSRRSRLKRKRKHKNRSTLHRDPFDS